MSSMDEKYLNNPEAWANKVRKSKGVTKDGDRAFNQKPGRSTPRDLIMQRNRFGKIISGETKNKAGTPFDPNSRYGKSLSAKVKQLTTDIDKAVKGGWVDPKAGPSMPEEFKPLSMFSNKPKPKPKPVDKNVNDPISLKSGGYASKKSKALFTRKGPCK
tara:strand:- start:6862 stop:7338 length:477 start_codon:yes stop_codon:yes gene_type:complete